MSDPRLYDLNSLLVPSLQVFSNLDSLLAVHKNSLLPAMQKELQGKTDSSLVHMGLFLFTLNRT